jgi:acetolactate decarboxylase
MEGLLKRLDWLFPNRDVFYAVHLTGEFEMVKTRSVPKQSRPYPPLVEAAKRQQISTATDVSGDLVALYCPPAAAGLNVVGWHVHFLNAQRNRGGHLLDLRAQDLKVEGMVLNGLQAILPGFEEYNNAKLCKDREAELNRVER